MAKAHLDRLHRVKATIHVTDLTKAGTSIWLEVYAEAEKIGTIVIGRGSLTWFGGKRKSGQRISWSKFADLMNQHCYGL